MQESKKKPSLNLKQIMDLNKQISPTAKKPDPEKNASIMKSEELNPVHGIFKLMPATTEKPSSVSSVGIYGDDFEYYDILPKKVTLFSQDIKESNKNNETEKPVEPFKNILLKMKAEDEENPQFDTHLIFDDRFKNDIQGQLNLVTESKNNTGFKKSSLSISDTNSSTNNYIEKTEKPDFKSILKDTNEMGITQNPVIQDFMTQSFTTITPDPIQPYYVFKTPLKVKLLNDDTGAELPTFFSLQRRKLGKSNHPVIGKNEFRSNPGRNDDTLSSTDMQLLKLNPYDKDSMFNLGMYLKEKFIGNSKDAKKVDLNVISRRNLPDGAFETPIESENGDSQPQKHKVVRDTIIQNGDYNKLNLDVNTLNNLDIASSDKPVDKNIDFNGCQLEIKSLKRSYPEKCSSLMASPSNVELKSTNKEQPCKVIPIFVPISRKIEFFRMPRVAPKHSNKQFFFNNFLQIVKGIRIDIRETQLKNYVS